MWQHLDMQFMIISVLDPAPTWNRKKMSNALITFGAKRRKWYYIFKLWRLQSEGYPLSVFLSNTCVYLVWKRNIYRLRIFELNVLYVSMKFPVYLISVSLIIIRSIQNILVFALRLAQLNTAKIHISRYKFIFMPIHILGFQQRRQYP